MRVGKLWGPGLFGRSRALDLICEMDRLSPFNGGDIDVFLLGLAFDGDGDGSGREMVCPTFFAIESLLLPGVPARNLAVFALVARAMSLGE